MTETTLDRLCEEWDTSIKLRSVLGLCLVGNLLGALLLLGKTLEASAGALSAINFAGETVATLAVMLAASVVLDLVRIARAPTHHPNLTSARTHTGDVEIRSKTECGLTFCAKCDFGFLFRFHDRSLDIHRMSTDQKDKFT